MSILLADKYDIKNSGMPRSNSNQNVIGYRDNLIINENYISIKLQNYSNVGWVFGLAQYGVTPVTTSAGVTEMIYMLSWTDRVIYHGNDSDLTSGTNMSITNGYKNLQITASDIDATFRHNLLKDVNSTYKYFTIIVNSQLVTSEPYELSIELSSDLTYTSVPVTLRNGYHGENIYLYSQVSLADLILHRIAQDTTYNNQIIKTITVYGYDTIQPYTERFINYEFLNINNTTGNLTQGRWEGNTGDVLESNRIFFSSNTNLKSIDVDISNCDSNLDFTVDELWLSPDGINWEKARLLNSKYPFIQGSQFPMTFPFAFGSLFANITSDFALYYKIIAKKDGTYIDCTKDNSSFNIQFYLD